MDLRETGSNEHRHPWELSRADCVIKTIAPYINGKVIADVGCGDLYFSNIVLKNFNSKIFAIDTGFTQEICENNKITKLNDITELKDNSVDIVILMDVLEHIEDTGKFLSLLSNKVVKEGILFITVPAFQHLYSEHDVFLKHYRRYNRKSLSTTFTACGFKVEGMFYFYSALYVMRLIQFLITRFRKNKGMVNNISLWKYGENALLTKLVRKVLNLDFCINKNMGKLSPFGLSLFAVCKKTE